MAAIKARNNYVIPFLPAYLPFRLCSALIHKGDVHADLISELIVKRASVHIGISRYKFCIIDLECKIKLVNMAVYEHVYLPYCSK